MKYIMKCIFVVVLTLTLIVPTVSVASEKRTNNQPSDYQVYQDYLIDSGYEIKLNDNKYSLQFLKDKNVTQANDKNSKSLFFDKTDGDLVNDKDVLYDLTKMYLMGKTKTAYTKNTKIANSVVPFTILGKEIWEQGSVAAVSTVISSYGKKKPPIKLIKKAARNIVSSQESKLKNFEYATIIWGLTKYYGDIQKRLEYPYGEEGINVINMNDKKVIFKKSPNNSVDKIYNEFEEGFHEYQIFNKALEDLGLAVEPNVKAVLKETYNVMTSGILDGLSNSTKEVKTSRLQKDYMKIYENIIANNIELTTSAAPPYIEIGGTNTDLYKNLDKFINERIQYKEDLEVMNLEKKEDLDSFVQGIYSRDHSSLDSFIKNKLDPDFERPEYHSTGDMLFGTWDVFNGDSRTKEGTITLFSEGGELGQISGKWDTGKGTYNVKGEVVNGKVKLKLFYNSYDHILKDMKLTSIPDEKHDYFAEKLDEQKDKFYKSLTLSLSGDFAELATMKTYKIKYNKETYKLVDVISAVQEVDHKYLLWKQEKEDETKKDKHANEDETKDKSIFNGYLSSKDYLFTKDSMYGRYMARAAINDKLTFENHPFYKSKVATNNLGKEIDNFIAFKIDGAGDNNQITYALLGEYERLSFTLNLSKYAKNTPQTTTFKVYTDGNEVYSTEVKKGYLPEKIDIDLDGVKKLKFELNEIDSSSYNNKATEVILEKPALYSDEETKEKQNKLTKEQAIKGARLILQDNMKYYQEEDIDGYMSTFRMEKSVMKKTREQTEKSFKHGDFNSYYDGEIKVNKVSNDFRKVLLDVVQVFESKDITYKSWTTFTLENKNDRWAITKAQVNKTDGFE